MAILNPCHPAEILRDNPQVTELSVTEVSSRLDWPGRCCPGC